ncbi:hypothetical protein DFJ74DRAFT_686556 [Hyaloraphidium curvatum]|nr:hypothetical protein DFJ74DRAFT_686556 [Hyaloraphidium curvatum]
MRPSVLHLVLALASTAALASVLPSASAWCIYNTGTEAVSVWDTYRVGVDGLMNADSSWTLTCTCDSSKDFQGTIQPGGKACWFQG